MARPAGSSTPSCCGSRSASATTAGRAARAGRARRAPPGAVPPAQPPVGHQAAGHRRAAARDHLHLQPGRLRRRGAAVPGLGAAADDAAEADEIAALATERTAACPRLTWPCWATTRGWPGCGGHRRASRRAAAHLQGGGRGAVRGGLIRAVFATETLALGIRCRPGPWSSSGWTSGTARPTPTSRRGVHPAHRPGRAARHRHRGARGGAVAPRAGPGLGGGPGRTRTYPLNSSFQPSYNMAVNLVGQVGRQRARRPAGVVVRPVPGRPRGGRPGPPGGHGYGGDGRSCRWAASAAT